MQRKCCVYHYIIYVIEHTRVHNLINYHIQLYRWNTLSVVVRILYNTHTHTNTPISLCVVFVTILRPSNLNKMTDPDSL